MNANRLKLQTQGSPRRDALTVWESRGEFAWGETYFCRGLAGFLSIRHISSTAMLLRNIPRT